MIKIKQHINAQELREFIKDPKAKDWLCNQLGTNYVRADMVRIGEMIGILDKHSKINDWSIEPCCNIYRVQIYIKYNCFFARENKILCNALWEAVQYIYENEEVN